MGLALKCFQCKAALQVLASGAQRGRHRIRHVEALHDWSTRPLRVLIMWHFDNLAEYDDGLHDCRRTYRLKSTRRNVRRREGPFHKEPSIASR